MSPKRSRFQVSVDVLTAIYNGDRVKEKIMDTCTLSRGSIDDTLTFLAEKGYVDELYAPPQRGLATVFPKKVGPS